LRASVNVNVTRNGPVSHGPFTLTDRFCGLAQSPVVLPAAARQQGNDLGLGLNLGGLHEAAPVG
jgi:hypothetical protein